MTIVQLQQEGMQAALACKPARPGGERELGRRVVGDVCVVHTYIPRGGRGRGGFVLLIFFLNPSFRLGALLASWDSLEGGRIASPAPRKDGRMGKNGRENFIVGPKNRAHGGSNPFFTALC